MEIVKGPKESTSLFTKSDLVKIRKYPHLIGHLAGYDLLTTLHSEWIHYVWDTSAKNTPKTKAIWCHRQAYKTVAITVVGTVWRLLFFPEETIMIWRKTHQEAVDTVTDIAKIMQSPIIRELFLLAHGEYPEFKTQRLGEARIDFKFRKKPNIAPSVLGVGTNSPLVGKHCSFVIMDDVSTVEDRVSKAERERTMLIYREMVSAILNKNGFARYVGTPWTRDGVESLIPTPIKFDVYSTGIIPKEKLDEIRGETTPILFSLNYELLYASDKDCLFSDIKMGKWDEKKVNHPKAQIDMAFGSKTGTGDTTAVTIGGEEAGDKLMMIGFIFKGAGPEWLPRIAEILRMYKVRTVAIETNTDKGWTAKELRKLGFNTKEYAESTKKEHKIATFLFERWNHTYFDQNTDPEYLLQIKDWMPGVKILDDAPDSAASLVRSFFSRRLAELERWKF